jgi:TRAP-type C4-dicarboxylate transport system permease small subunit
MAKLTGFLSTVSGVALALIVLLTVADVVMANLLQRPIIGAIEVVETALAFVFFLGIGEIFRGEHNIMVDVSDHFTGPRTRNRLRLFGAVLTVVFLVLMGWAMLAPAGDAWRFGDRKADSGIPLAVLWVPALFGTLIAIVAALQVGLRVWRERGSTR